MNDNVAAKLLESYTPPALDATPEWADVLKRARITRAQLTPGASIGASPATRQRRKFRRSLLLVAAALAGIVVLATVTPARSTISRTLGNFSAWLTGLPGTKAPPHDQAALNRATRSWLDFPNGTQLHRLLETKVDGVTLALDGFRVGDSLCLQIIATGAVSGSDQSCAPLSQLRAQKAPALVVLTDAAFGTISGKYVQIGPYVYTHSVRVDVTIGIVADGVDHVEIAGTSGGRRKALVESDAFLAIADRPPIGYRTNQAWAWASAGGKRVALDLAEAPFDQLNATPPKPRRPLGPTSIQRHVVGGTIGWLTRREPRGAPVPATGPFARLGRGPFVRSVLFQRLIAPDPNSPLRELIELVNSKNPLFPNQKGPQVCSSLVAEGGAGGGCSRVSELFLHGPVDAGEMLPDGGDQFEYLSGLVSDDVRRLTIFLSTGEQIAVPLRDNAFVAQVNRAGFPIRLVAYDSRNLRIDVQTLRDDAGGSATGPKLARGATWRTLLRATSPTGKQAKVLVAPKRGGGLCASFQLSDGSSQGGCSFSPWRGPALNLSYSSSTNTAGPAFIWGQTKPAIATVDVRLADGTTLHLRPARGLLLAALPRGFRAGPGDQVIGYDKGGHLVAREQLPAT